MNIAGISNDIVEMIFLIPYLSIHTSSSIYLRMLGIK